MTKIEFLQSLEAKLKATGVENADEYLEYYSELIDDKTEAFGNEADAVSSMENIDTVVLNAVLDGKTIKDVFTEKVSGLKEKAKEKGRKGILMLISVVSSPFWVPLLLALIGIGVAIYLAIWAVIVAFFGCEAAVGAAGLFCLYETAQGLIRQTVTMPSVIAYFGAGLILIGVCVLLFRPIILASRLMLRLLSQTAKAIKRLVARI